MIFMRSVVCEAQHRLVSLMHVAVAGWLAVTGRCP